MSQRILGILVGRVPLPNDQRPVLTAREQKQAVFAELDGPDGGLMGLVGQSAEWAYLQSLLGQIILLVLVEFPENDRVVVRAGEELGGAAGVKHDALDVLRVPVQNRLAPEVEILLVVHFLPDPDRFVARARGDTLGVARPRHSLDLIFVALQNGHAVDVRVAWELAPTRHGERV